MCITYSILQVLGFINIYISRRTLDPQDCLRFAGDTFKFQ